VQVGLPTTGTLADGSTENKPERNVEVEYFEFEDYTVNRNEVIANYIVKQKEPAIMRAITREPMPRPPV